MFVMQLIGRQAGEIIEMPYHAATNAIASGTARDLTQEEKDRAEVRASGAGTEVEPDTLPDGYAVEPLPEGGFAILDSQGERINEAPAPNLVAARQVAESHAEAAASKDSEDGLEKLTRAELDAMAADLKIDASSARTKADVIELIRAAEKSA